MDNLKTNLTATLQAGLRFLSRPALAVYAPIAAAAESTTTDQGSPLLYLTGLIDIRIATAVSVLSLIILAGLRKTDFKGRFGIWVGRFIVFILVVLNIGLWSTQV